MVMPTRDAKLGGAAGIGAAEGRRPTAVPPPAAATPELSDRPRRRTFTVQVRWPRQHIYGLLRALSLDPKFRITDTRHRVGDGNSIVEFIESFCLRVASPSLVDTVEFFVVTLSVHLSPRDST
jgi:hypothetical protein